ncbi:hypothetical protein BGX28_000585 [Mortierella sp. GBA30]|nr:hypothetical protein BGX28_000585 [Mortierella sp. GBA30]
MYSSTVRKQFQQTHLIAGLSSFYVAALTIDPVYINNRLEQHWDKMKVATAERDQLAAQANQVLSPKIRRYQMCLAQRAMAAEHSGFIAEERKLLLTELEQDRQNLMRLRTKLNQQKETLKLSMARFQVSKMNGRSTVSESISEKMELWASAHQKLGHSRRVLVAELVTLFDLKCVPERRRNPVRYSYNDNSSLDQSIHSASSAATGTTAVTTGLSSANDGSARKSTKLRVRDYLEDDSWNEYLIVGRPLPTGYFENYDRDEINTTIESVIHMMTLVACYLGIKLPFDTVLRHSRYYIQAAFTAGSKRAPLFLSEDNILLFASGLAHLNYNIAYLCHSQGVHITLANAANTLENLLACCQAPNLGRYTNYASIMTKKISDVDVHAHSEDPAPISPTSDDGGFENIRSDVGVDRKKVLDRNEYLLWCPGQEPFDLNVHDLIALIRSRREEESPVWGGLHLQDAVAANLGTLEDDFIHEDQEEEDGMYTLREATVDSDRSLKIGWLAPGSSSLGSGASSATIAPHISQNGASFINPHSQRRPAHPSRDRRQSQSEQGYRIPTSRSSDTSFSSMDPSQGYGHVHAHSHGPSQPENWTFLDVDIPRVPSSGNRGPSLLSLSGRGWPDISVLKKVGSAMGGAAAGLVNGAALAATSRSPRIVHGHGHRASSSTDVYPSISSSAP